MVKVADLMFALELTIARNGVGCKVTAKRETETAAMIGGRETFGACIRREREARGIGLRQMAKKIGVSPTYLSKVERDEFKPPTEAKVRAISRFIERDPDELLAMAGRVPSDVADIIKRHPVELSAWVRLSNEWPAEYIIRTTQVAMAVTRVMEEGIPDTLRDLQWVTEGRTGIVQEYVAQVVMAVMRAMEEEGRLDWLATGRDRGQPSTSNADQG